MYTTHTQRFKVKEKLFASFCQSVVVPLACSEVLGFYTVR